EPWLRVAARAGGHAAAAAAASDAAPPCRTLRLSILSISSRRPRAAGPRERTSRPVSTALSNILRREIRRVPAQLLGNVVYDGGHIDVREAAAEAEHLHVSGRQLQARAIQHDLGEIGSLRVGDRLRALQRLVLRLGARTVELVAVGARAR